MIKTYQQDFEKFLQMLINRRFSKHPYFPHYESIFMRGGKRMRPVICLRIADLFCDYIEALPVAASVEFVHTYSLIHDDLPSMDDDDFRRGLPACHKLVGEAGAILMGDGLIADAFQLIVNPNIYNNEATTESIDISKTDAIKHMQVHFQTHWLSAAIDSYGMVLGQILDIEQKQPCQDLDTILNIHRYKTGYLFACAAKLGASYAIGKISQECQEDLFKAFDAFGLNFGLSFQILDDILDWEDNARDDCSQEPVNILHAINKELALSMAQEAIHESGANLQKIQQIASKALFQLPTDSFRTPDQFMARLESLKEFCTNYYEAVFKKAAL